MTEPVTVRILPRKISVGELGGAILITAVPVAIAVLMQRPALRQELAMKAWYQWQRFTGAMSEFWQNQNLNAGTEYNKARMLWGFGRTCGRL